MPDEEKFFWSGTEIASTQFPEVGFWVDQLVAKVGIVLLYGKFGSYKTPLTIHLAHCVATGAPFLGLATTQTPVLYIEGDTPQLGLWPRLQAMNPATPNLDFTFIYPGFNVLSPLSNDHNKRITNSLTGRHRTIGYGLVVVDSLRTSHPMADKDSEVPSQVYGAFARLFPGAAILIVHHDRKSRLPDYKSGGNGRFHSGGDDDDIDNESFSGSQAWIDRATTAIKLRKSPSGDKDWLTIAQSKSQVGPTIEPLHVHVANGCQFTVATAITDAAFSVALTKIGQSKSRNDLDNRLAAYFNQPLKLVRARRIHYESTVQPIK